MMQHASILHRQRAFGSMRVLSRATITRLAIPGPEVSWLGVPFAKFGCLISVEFADFWGSSSRKPCTS